MSDSRPPSAPAPSPDRNLAGMPRRTQLRWLAAAALLLALVVLGVWLAGRWSNHEEVATAPPAGTFKPTPQQLKALTVEPVAVHRFATVEIADARVAVNADRTTPVYAPYSGRVVSVVAAFGDFVREGAPLATIEAEEYADALNAFEAASGAARLARATEARKHALVEANGGSQQDWQQAQSDLATAEAALAAARNHLRIFGLADAAIDAADAHPPATARIALTAPIAGVVVDRSIGPGQYVTAGSGTALYTVADLANVWIVGTLGERAAAHARRGQAVTVTVAALGGRAFSAHLEYVAPTLDATSHRLTVRAALDNKDLALRPEMLATLSIDAGDVTSGPGVPVDAVVYEGEQAHVWVVGADDTIGLRQIRAGRSTDGLVEVLDGLTPGERVVTRGSLFIDRAARLD
jgi:cobalt-zinc-cadmium efflux system membrane fusion protein